MDFSLSEEEQEFATTIRRFALERLLPEYSRWDRGEQYPREKIKELAELGIMGLRVPVEHGGAGASSVMCGVAAEELARGDYNTTLFLQIETIAADILTNQGSPAMQREWLPRVVSGDAIMAFALTEPDAGSDAAAITTRARRDGDEWVIDGEKASITFAGFADAAIVIARTTEEGGARGMGAVLVPLDRPGITRSVYSSFGERLSQRGSLVFDGVRVPLDHMLGDEHSGFIRTMEAFDYNRAIISLCCVGAAQQSLEETIQYTKLRKTFGKPLATREGVAFQIAEHLTMVEAARLLAYQCLWRRDHGLPHTKDSAMAKWLGPKASAEAIHACIILHGWIGYGKELPLEQRLRDVIGLEIGDGTPEIMKGIVAREVFGREFVSYR